MSKKIQLLAGIILILFCIISLFIAILVIWDVINNEIAQDAFLKTLYTLGSIFLVSMVVLLITKITGDKK